MADSSYKQDLKTKIDEIFWFNLSNSLDGVDYNFWQYKLNQPYKPLIKIFVNEFSKFLDSNDKSESDQIVSLFLDFFRLYYFQWDFGYFKSKYSSFKYKIPYGMDYSGRDSEFWRPSRDCYYVKTSDIVNEMDFQIPTEDLTTKTIRIQFFKRTRQDAEWKATSLDTEIQKNINNETWEFIGYDIFIYNFDEDKATRTAKEKIILDKIQEFWIQITPGLKDTLSEFLAKRWRDYFIHKRLKDFLKWELERYLFQVLKLDMQWKIDILSVQNKIEELREKYKWDNDYIDFQIAKIYAENSTEVKPTIYQSAYVWILNFINILWDLEDFKAKLWNKKRKIVKQEYCISLGTIKELETLIPRKENMLKYIFDNKKQIQEWKDLWMSDNPTVDDNSLIVDTNNFNWEERENLINLINEDKVIWKLYNSDNYQALSYMKEDNAWKIDCIYIDPPYNTWNDGFVYKDGFNESSWLSMMEDRLRLAKQIMADSWVICISIDDKEQSALKRICDNVFGEEMFVWTFIRQVMEWWKSDSTGIATEHEYCHIYANLNFNWVYKKKSDKLWHYTKEDKYVNERGKYYLKPLENWWLWYVKSLDYAIEWPDGVDIYPGDFFGDNWYRRVRSKEKYQRAKEMDMIEFTKSSKDKTKYKVYYKIYEKMDTDWNFVEKELPFPSLYLDWYTNRQWVNDLKKLFWNAKLFSYPKPVSFIIETINMTTKDNWKVLDFFAGSWTTWQATLSLNKQDWGHRKFIEVELWNYFDDVTLIRTKKAQYSQNRKDWKAIDNDWTQWIIEYNKLNQYEDRFSLNWYLTKIEDEISQLRDFDIQENTKISQILSPLNELKEHIYNIDDELTNEELLSVYND